MPVGLDDDMTAMTVILSFRNHCYRRGGGGMNPFEHGVFVDPHVRHVPCSLRSFWRSTHIEGVMSSTFMLFIILFVDDIKGE